MVVTRDGSRSSTATTSRSSAQIVESGASSAPIEKGNYRHFMQKEIFEQPIVVAQTLQSYVRPLEGKVALPEIDFDLGSGRAASPSSPAAPASTPAWSPNTGSSSSPACRSTSMSPASSATASRCWSRAGWRCSSRKSGETADTLAALRHARARAADDRGRRQRADQLDGARGRPAAADPCRARRSASPRPRPSPASSRCSPRSPPISRAPRAG